MLISWIVLAMVSLMLLAWVLKLRDTGRRQRRGLDWYEQTYLCLNGHILGRGIYNLISVDRGRHWFYKQVREDGVVITGPADPEVVDQLKGLQALSTHMMKYGPIGPTDLGQSGLLDNTGRTATRHQ